MELESVPIEELFELLQSRQANERADAACALGDCLRTREVSALEPHVHERLADLLADEVPMVQLEAAIALAELHDRRATDLLVAATRWRTFRLDATRSLGTLGDEAAIEPLTKIMNGWLYPWADCLQAAAALCALGEAEGQAYLEARTRHRRRPERAAALHFVGESRHPRALALLSEVLGNPNDPMRDVAARALGLLGDARAAETLVAAREGADAELRADIEEALERLQASGG